jgi:hypothetical protein
MIAGLTTRERALAGAVCALFHVKRMSTAAIAARLTRDGETITEAQAYNILARHGAEWRRTYAA